MGVRHFLLLAIRQIDMSRSPGATKERLPPGGGGLHRPWVFFGGLGVRQVVCPAAAICRVLCAPSNFFYACLGFRSKFSYFLPDFP